MLRAAFLAVAIGAFATTLGGPRLSAAQPAVVVSPHPSPALAVGPAAGSPAPGGLAVVALPGATDAAWPLARSVYADASLRPPTLDDTNARLLCGEPALAGASAAARDLADTIAALRGDDAPTRALLEVIAGRFSVPTLLVVRTDAGGASARPFLVGTGAFDAATYTPDKGAPLRWSNATRSLARSFGLEPARASMGPLAVPALATHEGPRAPDAPAGRRAFYESGWFWGALGAAALAGGAVFLATRDSGASTIHLQVQVPR